MSGARAGSGSGRPPRARTRKAKPSKAKAKKKGPKRLQKEARERQQRANHQSLYRLSNVQYYDMCGFTAAARSQRRWRHDAGLDVLDALLARDFATCNRRTWDTHKYLAWIELHYHIDPATATATTTATASATAKNWWSQQWEERRKRKYSKLRFATHQKQQRAFATIAKQLTNNRPPSTYVVLWGAGSFGPTSRGHASAPNKLLRHELRHHGLDIRLVDERYTSKYTACCHVRSQYSEQRQQPSQRALRSQPPGAAHEVKVRTLRGLLYCVGMHERTHSQGDAGVHSTNPLLTHQPLLLSSQHQQQQQQQQDAANAARGPHHYHGQGSSQAIARTSSNGCTSPATTSTTTTHTTTTRSRPWNRDVCAAINIMHRAYGAAYGCMHPCFLGPTGDGAGGGVRGVLGGPAAAAGGG